MRYEKRPLTVLAAQFDPENLPHKDSETPPKYVYSPEMEKWKVKTAEGWQWIKDNDWILYNELDGKYYIKSNRDFHLNYRPVDE